MLKQKSRGQITQTRGPPSTPNQVFVRKQVTPDPSAKNLWVAYPELHDHSVQRSSLGHHHSARPQVLVQGSPHIPEVQIVPWQQAGGKERLTQQERDLEIRVRSRTKTSEDSSEKKHRSQVSRMHSFARSLSQQRSVPGLHLPVRIEMKNRNKPHPQEC